MFTEPAKVFFPVFFYCLTFPVTLPGISQSKNPLLHLLGGSSRIMEKHSYCTVVHHLLLPTCQVLGQSTGYGVLPFAYYIVQRYECSDAAYMDPACKIKLPSLKWLLENCNRKLQINKH